MSIKLLPNLENQERIANALERLNNILEGQSIKSKVYGVSGLGQENPVLIRTYDSVGVLLNLSTNGDFIECVASDNAFQEFFNFQETTDIHGNVFLTITPKSFRIDRVSNGEITAFSVKEYEDGDENIGFHVHSAFKKWITENEYQGVGSIQIAKYMSAALDKTTNQVFEGFINNTNKGNIKVSSLTGKDIMKSSVEWGNGVDIIKATDPNYSHLNWMYVDLLRMLMTIYFARLDVHRMFNVPFETNDNPEWGYWKTIDTDPVSGKTDAIVSHTGFYKTGSTYKIFGFDNMFAGTNMSGKYIYNSDLYYSHLFDFDIAIDEGVKTVLTPLQVYSSEDFDIITKMGFDPSEPALKIPSSMRQTTPEFPEERVQNIYYSAKYKNWSNTLYRCSTQAFNYCYTDLHPDAGIYNEFWSSGLADGWGDRGDSIFAGLRLCKPPQ